MLRERIKAQSEMIEGTILRGKCDDHAEYRYMVGRLDGLRIALRELTEVEGESDSDD